ncbi:hypothetical protein LTS08_006020 [Lithohypha guttulata]|uniref:uncharacterized protein n=1 Tax=Lithohypha guttulata TaxID=1690604 RepID=UPI002DE07894|nr:hypothetical protein LTR51_002534 [Lithohypha guttulata]KAK5099438.1 hypothetical protein LTS08_006020 [Lithohypha guttulata]
MLPSPSASFTLPSSHDNLEIDCRLYFPRPRAQNREAEGETYVKGCAIFAHPYAPLGGCYDDPVVQSVGSLLLKQGFLLTTFNFRGADKSPGRTSWTGRAEVGDYVSLYIFTLAFLNAPHIVEQMTHGCPLLVLGGYSYGSMVAAHLPGIDTMLKALQHAELGSATHEIKQRANELAQTFLDYCEAQRDVRLSSNKAHNEPSLQGTTFGGYESPAAAQKITRDAQRGMSLDVDRVRHSIDKIRHKIRNESTTSRANDPKQQSDRTRFDPQDKKLSAIIGSHTTDTRQALSSVPSLVVFGSADHFTSSRKARNWCQAIKEKPGSKLQFHEVAEAGHFWHDENIGSMMRKLAADWLQAILEQQRTALG